MTQVANLPETVSYSQLTTFLDCGERYELERVKRVTQTPAWWFLGGSAAHATTEVWDAWHEGAAGLLNVDQPDLEAVFAEKLNLEIAEADESGVPRSQWFAGGRGKATEDFWLENGPVWVRYWADWRETSGWKLWNYLGDPAVEVPLVQHWSNGLKSRGFIDRVMYDTHGYLNIVDLKFGSTTPDSAAQLGLYAVGLEQEFGIRPQFGAFFMARKGKLLAQEPLRKYTEPYFDRKFSGFDQARKAGIFLANPGEKCSRCGVRGSCSEWRP